MAAVPTPSQAPFVAVVDAEAAVDERLLLRTLADGAPRSLSAIARLVTGGTDGAAMSVVAAALDALRAAGMPLELDGDTVRASPFVALDRRAIDEGLAAGGVRWETRVVHTTASTNTDLLDEVRTAPEPIAPRLLAAEIQSGGRGRLGRTWSSAPGAALTASFALTVGRRLSGLDGVTLVCGLALRDVLARRGVRAALKWPNDVLVDGKKVAGILVETHPVGAATVLVVGVGVNVSARPATGQSTSLATTALQAGGPPIDRNLLVAQIACALHEHLARFAAGGFDVFVDEWNEADAFRDRPVALHAMTGPALAGIARGVDRGGALLIDVDGVRTRVIAGDLSLRPVPSGPAQETRG